MAAEQMPNASFSTTIIEKCDVGTIFDVAIPSFRFGWMKLFSDDNQPSTPTPRKLSSKICSPICCRTVVMTKVVEAQSTKFIPFGPSIRHHNVEIPQHVWRLCDSKELVDGFAKV
jgi:hypothetical protein